MIGQSARSYRLLLIPEVFQQRTLVTTDLVTERHLICDSTTISVCMILIEKAVLHAHKTYLLNRNSHLSAHAHPAVPLFSGLV